MLNSDFFNESFSLAFMNDFLTLSLNTVHSYADVSSSQERKFLHRIIISHTEDDTALRGIKTVE